MKNLRTWIAVATICSAIGLAGRVLAAPEDLPDTYAKLKDAVAKKDADAVKTTGAQALKLAQALINAPKPTDADDAKNWQQGIEYGKEVSAYTEYALAFMAAQGLEPAKTVELVDTLIAQNPKSQYLDVLCTNAYLAALGKDGGEAKQLEGMAQILKGRPENEVALEVLANAYISKSPDRALLYANRLIAAVGKNPKPEGESEADWSRTKNAMLATGYYVSGVDYGAKQAWVDCDKHLKLALPLLAGDQNKLGIAYFYLGLANYQFGKLTQDRPKMQLGLQYTTKSVAIRGPMQNQAYRNQLGMQQELNTRH